MTHRTARIAATLLALAAGSVFQSAEAQLISNRPYAFQARDPSVAAQAQMQERAGPSMIVNQYYSLSTSIGNMTEVTQNLGAGATATLTMNQTQTSQGHQTSSARTGLAEIERLTQPRQ